MYILDANVSIQAHRAHYGLDFVPGSWDCLGREHNLGVLASVDSVKKELDSGKGALTIWEQRRGVMFVQMDSATAPSLTQLASWAATPANAYPQEAGAEFLGSADYQLVSYGHAHGHTVVTHEKADNLGTKKKIRIPGACHALQVPPMDSFKMLRDEHARFALGPKPVSSDKRS
ncbi:MAG: DUF4411 family protein [Bifidobacteriaceae bacterium]|jgi:hypothetical protein|nr:DUF4411 family protein [Bifidobacteriaceae bacterium]